MIYTSRYLSKGNDPGAISISQSITRDTNFSSGVHERIFAPTWELINMLKSKSINFDQYTTEYVKLILQRDINWEYWKEFLTEKINNNEDVYFLCYEERNQNCHRHIFADIMKEKTGIDITEWLPEKEQKEQQHIDRQNANNESLFC